MANHLRRQIRDAAKAALTGLTTTGSRVYTGRSRPLGRAHQPSLLIYTPQETSRRAVNGHPPILERTVQLMIEGRVSNANEPDDLLDDIAKEVEAAMWTNRALGGLVFNTRLGATDSVTEAEGERQIGGIRLTYEVTFQTPEGAADQNGAIAD